MSNQIKNVDPQKPSNSQDFELINSTMSILTRNQIDNLNQSSINQIKAKSNCSPANAKKKKRRKLNVDIKQDLVKP